MHDDLIAWIARSKVIPQSGVLVDVGGSWQFGESVPLKPGQMEHCYCYLSNEELRLKTKVENQSCRINKNCRFATNKAAFRRLESYFPNRFTQAVSACGTEPVRGGQHPAGASSLVLVPEL